MKFTKQIELTFTEAVIRFVESSWLVQQYPNFFGFLSAKPKAIIIGNTPSMLPKILPVENGAKRNPITNKSKK